MLGNKISVHVFSLDRLISGETHKIATLYNWHTKLIKFEYLQENDKNLMILRDPMLDVQDKIVQINKNNSIGY